MKAVILCGGYGTRIRDVATDIPKPLIPIGDAPILWHIMKYYSLWGIDDFILCLGYKGNQIKDFFLNYEAKMNDLTIDFGKGGAVSYHNTHGEVSWRVTMVDTGLHSLTGTRVSLIKEYLEDENDFMLTYGDGVSNIDIEALLAFHHRHKNVLTVSGVRPPGRFGEIQIGGDNEVVAFNEKPQTSGGIISGGFFVCSSELFDYLPRKENVMLEREPIENLVKDGKMKVYVHEGFWQCMDTQRDFNLLNDLVETRTAPWMIW